MTRWGGGWYTGSEWPPARPRTITRPVSTAAVGFPVTGSPTAELGAVRLGAAEVARTFNVIKAPPAELVGRIHGEMVQHLTSHLGLARWELRLAAVRTTESGCDKADKAADAPAPTPLGV